MRICSVTLAGPGTEDIIGDALRSVPWVDQRVVILTHPEGSTEWTAIHRALSDIKGNIRFIGIPWRDDFAFMRNDALDAAISAQQNHAWAVWLDTDERLVGDGDKIRAYLASLPEHVCAVHAMDTRREYGKERFIRLPRRGKYIGLTHEYWQPDEGQIIASTDLLTFDELPRDRSGEAWAHKLERDDRLLKAQFATDPDLRWLYYRGDTAMLQGKPDKAVSLWRRAAAMDGWPEMRSWAAYRAGSELMRQGQDREALAIMGRAAAAGCPYAELLYGMAMAHLKLGDAGNAFHWADLAARRGSFEGVGGYQRRSGYVHPPAHFEGPFQILAQACEAMDMPDAALAAWGKAKAAKQRREAA